MNDKVVPMIHVPDVRATVDWYKSIGFTVRDTYGDDGDGLSFAILSFGKSEVMFNQGGATSAGRRREVDLYIYTKNIDDVFERLKEQVDVVEPPHDTFYGMREFIFRDLNRFWITFAEQSVFATLMNGVQQGNADLVHTALTSGRLKPQALSAALIISRSRSNADVTRMLEQAGATSPPAIDSETLQSYTGTYAGEAGMELNITFKEGNLFAALGSESPLTLMAIDDVTFTPIWFDNYGEVKFQISNGKAVGCELRHPGGITAQLRRIERS